MRISLIAALFLSSFSLHAMSLNKVMSNLPKSVNVKTGKVNLDGSVTFSEITVSRGDQTYRLSYDTSFKSVCKLLRFDDSLKGTNLNIIKYSSSATYPMVLLDDAGKFSQTVTRNDYVEKVTCFKGKVTPKVEFDMTENADGSRTITKIRYLRGDQAYKLAYDNSFASVCTLLGFEEVLTGASLNENTYTSDSPYAMALLDLNATFLSTPSRNDYIRKVTCYSGDAPELVILLDGVRYRKI